MFLSKLFKPILPIPLISKPNRLDIINRSNVIQYDEMGYPLRLVMIDLHDGTVDHIWLDTEEEEGDVVLEWENN